MPTESDGHQHPEQVAWPSEMSRPGWSFVDGHEGTLSFVFFVTTVVQRVDATARVAIEALYKDGNPSEYTKQIGQLERDGPLKTLQRHHRSILLEMTLCRVMENFLTYVAELMASIYTTRPETLRSGEQVRLDDVLKHSTMDAFVTETAERKVNELSYQGMRKLSQELTTKLGFALFPQEDQLQRAILLIEYRNIITHNRAIVNKVFLSRVGPSARAVGEELQLGANDLFEAMGFIARAAVDIDARAVAKFSLTPQSRLRAPVPKAAADLET